MGERPAYIHGSTARRFERVQPAEQRGIGVIPGGAREERAASHGAILFARVLVALIVAFALIGCVRISLSSATVAAAMEASEIDDMISEARDVGSQLEVTQSSLANPTRVKRDAIAIGMRSPTSASFIDISGDIVVKDAEGRLSLSGSVEAAAAAAAAEAAEAAEAEGSDPSDAGAAE